MRGVHIASSQNKTSTGKMLCALLPSTAMHISPRRWPEVYEHLKSFSVIRQMCTYYINVIMRSMKSYLLLFYLQFSMLPIEQSHVYVKSLTTGKRTYKSNTLWQYFNISLLNVYTTYSFTTYTFSALGKYNK